jgi:hypothetical protein
MHVAVRSYLTAGVATVGAAAIALSPIAPPMPDVHLPSVRDAEVQLSAAVGPIETWLAVINQTITNVGAIGQQFAADPAPILQQVLANQAANAAIIAKDGQQVAQAITDALQAYPATLQTALGQIAAGDIVGGANTLLSPVIIDALNVILPLTDAIQTVSVNMVTNMANALGQIQNVALSLGSPILGAFVYSPVNAIAAIAQTVVDDAGTDPVGAITALVNAPATMLGAVLNGYGPGPLGSPQGLLGPNAGIAVLDGVIPAILAIRDDIAKAITPAPTANTAAAVVKSLATSKAAALPAGGTTVALSTGSSNVVKSTGASVKPSAAAATSTAAADPTTASDATTPVSPTTPTKAKHRASAATPASSPAKSAPRGSGATTHKASSGKSK